MWWVCLCLGIWSSCFAANPRPIEERAGYFQVKEANVDMARGDLLMCVEDLLLKGEGSLAISRVYDQRESEEGGWFFFPHVIADIDHFNNDRTGHKITISFKDVDGRNYAADNIGIGGMILDAKQEMGWQVLDANKKEVVIRSLQGEKRVYEKKQKIHVLTYQELCSGQEYVYEYDRVGKLLSIKALDRETPLVCYMTYASANSSKPGFSVALSDGRFVHYFFRPHIKKTSLLERVSTQEGEETISYHPEEDQMMLSERKIGREFCMKTVFEKTSQKLSSIEIHEKETSALYQFEYQGEEADLFLPDQARRHFHFTSLQGVEASKKCCKEIAFFHPKEERSYILDLEWNERGWLSQTRLYVEGDKKQDLWERTYLYGDCGELTAVCFSGDLTGKGVWDSYETTYEYDPLLRLIKIRQENGKEENILYQGQTRILAQKNADASIKSIEPKEIPFFTSSPSYTCRSIFTRDLLWFFPPISAEGSRFTAREQISEEYTKGGQKIVFLYNIDGTLRLHRIEGVLTREYYRDDLGRLIKEEIWDEKRKLQLQEISYCYQDRALAGWTQIYRSPLSGDKEEKIVAQFAYDAQGRKIAETFCRGEEILSRAFSYDLQGRLTEKIQGDISTTYKYNEVEEEGKRVCIEEKNQKGMILSREWLEVYKLEERMQNLSPMFFSLKADEKFPEPLQEIDEATVTKVYDKMGQLVEVYDKNKEIHYTFEYDVWGRVITYTDEYNKKTGYRNYDSLGHLIYEKFFNGIELTSQYDLEGRREKLKFDDGSFVKYLFEGTRLREVHRFERGGAPLYRHYILQRDSLGFPIEQLSAEGVGVMKFELDASRKISAVHWRNFHSQEMHSDALIEVEVPSVAFEYKFDALGRMTEVQSEGIVLFFNYDPWNRRMTKRTALGKKNYLKQNQYLAFMYDQEREIGAIDFETRQIKQLRVFAEEWINPGEGVIAYELEKRLYIPLFNIFGDLKELYDCAKNEVVERYEYTAQGASIVYDRWKQKLSRAPSGNPWRSLGKDRAFRLDEETGYLENKGRYFDPYRGLWHDK